LLLLSTALSGCAAAAAGTTTTGVVIIVAPHYDVGHSSAAPTPAPRRAAPDGHHFHVRHSSPGARRLDAWLAPSLAVSGRRRRREAGALPRPEAARTDPTAH